MLLLLVFIPKPQMYTQLVTCLFLDGLVFLPCFISQGAMGVFIELNLTESLEQLLHVNQEQRKKKCTSDGLD